MRACRVAHLALHTQLPCSAVGSSDAEAPESAPTCQPCKSLRQPASHARAQNKPPAMQERRTKTHLQEGHERRARVKVLRLLAAPLAVGLAHLVEAVGHDRSADCELAGKQVKTQC